MPCQPCLINPDFHSFVSCGSTITGVKLFYTSPAKTQDFNEDGSKLANFRLHIEEGTEGGPWIWVLDCTGMGFRHYTDVTFNLGLLDVFAKNTICGLRGSMRFSTSAPILQKVRYVEFSTRLELDLALRSKDVEPKAVEWLVATQP